MEEAGQEFSPTDCQPDYPRYVVPLEQHRPPGFLRVVDVGVFELGQEGVIR